MIGSKRIGNFSFLLVGLLFVSLTGTTTTSSFVLKPAVTSNRLSVSSTTGRQQQQLLSTFRMNTTTNDSTTMQQNQHEQSSTSSLPMYITIGPPCSGKTTWLRQQQPDIIDISIDDQKGVYRPLPTSDYFLWQEQEQSQQQSSHTNTTTDIDKKKQQERRDYLQSTMVHNQSLADRILADNNQECLAVLQRLGGYISAREFLETLQEINNNNNSNAHHIATFAAVLEDYIADQELDQTGELQDVLLPQPTTDLFVQDELFRGNHTAITRAFAQLTTESTEKAVAWANTNTAARDYAHALEIAAATQRPVVFVVCEPVLTANVSTTATTKDDNNDNDESTKLFDLHVPGSSTQELFRRCIRRLCQTGRYIPLHVIATMCDRHADLVRQASSTSRSKLALHQELARLAGFVMNDDRRIVGTTQRKRPYESIGQRGGGGRSKRGRGSDERWGRGRGRA
jgi:hypothetical protein